MRFKIESMRVLNYLKGRGFKVVDIKRTGKPHPVVQAPAKWNGVLVWVHEEGKKPVQVDKTRAIVQRAMETPELGLTPTQKIKFWESLPAVAVPVLKLNNDPLEVAFECLTSVGPEKETKLTRAQKFVVESGRGGWQSLTDQNWLPKRNELQ